jgi:hypothetical protein
MGLKDLTHALTTGHKLRESDPSMDGMNPDGTILINNYLIDTTSWKSFPLGMISTLQYNNQSWGKCFYAMVDTTQFIDYFQADLERFLTEFDFYNLFFYDPIHFLSNYLALYE